MTDTALSTPTAPSRADAPVALLSHCLANQNAKVDEYALYPGMVSPVVSLLRRLGYTIQQMPCPEMCLLGPRRWWQVRDQYDTPGFRRHCRVLAHSVADILSYRVAQGCGDVVLIGVDGSPSSAVSFTGVGARWGGRPEDLASEVVAGKGVWIEELEAVLGERALPMPRMIGLPMELPGFSMADSLVELEAFLRRGGSQR